MGLPTGTSYYIPITVDNTYISEDLSNFPYQIDMSAKLASDSTFKSHISSASNVAVYDPVADSVQPRIINLDLGDNKLLVHFDGPTNSSSNKSFYVCVGSGISESDSSAVFSNSSYAHRWGINEFSNGSTTVDDVGSNDGTVNSPAVIGATGGFGNCADNFPTTGYIGCGDITEFNSVAHFTLDFLININALGGSTRYALRKYLSASNDFMILWDSAGYFNIIVVQSGSNFYAYRKATIYMSAGQWTHFFIVYDGTLTDNINRLKIYINNVLVTGMSYIGTLQSTTPNLSSASFNIGYVNESFDGKLDELGIMSISSTQNFGTIRYNQFLQPSFWTIGSGVPVGGSGTAIYLSNSKKTINNIQIRIGDSWKHVSNKFIRIDSTWKSIS